MSESGVFNLGDLVWAKMRGFPAWPGRIVEPNDSLQKLRKTEKSQCVYFFGSHNYAWIDDNMVKPYADFKNEMMKLGKKQGASFTRAVDEAESFMDDPQSITEVITPARKKTQPQVRQSIVTGDTDDGGDDTNNRSSIDSGESPKKTPVVLNKVPITKRSTQKKSKPATPKPVNNSVTDEQSNDDHQTPAKRSRLASPPTVVTNHNVASYNNNNDLTESKGYASPVPRSARAARAVIDRNVLFSPTKPESTELDVTSISETLKSKNIKPSSGKFGFIGLGIMGSGIVKNLINSGHQVCVYNRTQEKTKKFEAAGATVMLTPIDVVEYADVTFSCVSDPQALKDTIFSQYGVCNLSPDIANGKGFVEMTTIDSDTSRDIQSALSGIGMRYLEAQIQGSKAQAEEGKLIILAAGDRSLFEECQTCFEAMGRNSFFLGDTGNATKMNLVLQTIAGISVAGLADSMALADKAGLSKETFMEILDKSDLRSDLIIEKGNAMIGGRYDKVNLPLMHLQKDLKLGIQMADALNHPMPLSAAANESYKHARSMGYSEYDVSAIYFRATH